MPLNQLLRYPDIVPLIPGTGVQFLDFGFGIEKNTPVPQEWGVLDAKTQFDNGQVPQLVRRGDEESTRTENYVLEVRDLIETFDRVWLPIPLFRRELSGGFFRGPLNWARIYWVKLAQPDADGHPYRLVLALDTTLLEFVDSDAYLAPSPADARNGRPFALPGHDEPIDWFYRDGWLKDWCLEAFKDMHERAERSRRGGYAFKPFTPDELHERMQGSNEHLARYKALIDLLHSLNVLPSFVFVDRITDPRPDPVDVDLVLDLGNSRTCGLLIESEPDQPSVDVNKAFRLQLRDLSRPEQVYDEPFPSRFEFARAQFGRDHLSLRSGRSNAFDWPTVVRVGNEAARLAARRSGSEGASGLSSPKRYLWDGDQRRDSWRFNASGPAGERSDIATGVAFTTLVNDSGEPIHRLSQTDSAPDQLFPSIRALYARRHLTAFALSEVFVQAISMINSPMHRLRRAANASLPRRMRRIILTMPTAMPVAERTILRQEAEAACDLACLALGLAQVDYADDGTQRLVFSPEARVLRNGVQGGPEVILRWDEATATQAVYLYTQLAQNYSGDARAFFDNVRHPANQADPETRDTLRIATIDLGGGTTDLVITRIAAEGRGAHVTLLPEQLFREGFTLAGDDALQRVVREHVIETIRQTLRQSGLGEGADYVLTQLVGGDRGNMTAIEQVRRQQFAAQIAAPIALGMLQEYESFDPLHPQPVTTRAFGDFFDADSRPADELIRHFNTEIEKLANRPFDLRQLTFTIDLPDIDRTVRSVFLEMLQALGEMVSRYRCDVLILSGRTSRLSAVRSILLEACPLPPHRVISLHQFRVGQWYPFRDYRATVGDPKTTAAVGAMICLLGDGRLHNFNFRSDKLEPRSTARYFGKLDTGSRLLAGDEFYDDLDLDDPDYPLKDKSFEFRGPMALGFRQLPVDRWPASRLYMIDYATPDAARELSAQTPLKIALRLTRSASRGAAPDGFAIDRIEDRDGRRIANTKLRLRLQTVSHQQGYWLDTGVLFER
ncbi:MAG: virulence factor SrfB [Caldimonas sp.]